VFCAVSCTIGQDGHKSKILGVTSHFVACRWRVTLSFLLFSKKLSSESGQVSPSECFHFLLLGVNENLFMKVFTLSFQESTEVSFVYNSAFRRNLFWASVIFSISFDFNLLWNFCSGFKRCWPLRWKPRWKANYAKNPNGRKFLRLSHYSGKLHKLFYLEKTSITLVALYYEFVLQLSWLLVRGMAYNWGGRLCLQQPIEMRFKQILKNNLNILQKTNFASVPLFTNFCSWSNVGNGDAQVSNRG